jgi:hypothetical protein
VIKEEENTTPANATDAAKKKRKRSFEEVLTAAMKKSESNAETSTFFQRILTQLDTSGTSKGQYPATVELWCEPQHTTGHSIETGFRKKFNDNIAAKNRPKNHDVVFDGKELEIKFSKKGFAKLATDSRALRPSVNKWYLYTKGEIKTNQNANYNVWIISAESLFNELEEDRAGGGMIDIENENGEEKEEKDVLGEIQKEIEALVPGLAQAIFNKATGKTSRQKMTLSKKVGINKVRFDIKFETLLRSCIKEILRS